MTKIPDLSIESLRRLYSSGELSPAQLVSTIYDRVESQPLHPVWISLVRREEALAFAQEIEEQKDLPLYGIPFAIKDNIDANGYPTTAGCPAFAYTPAQDAFVVARLREAGAILIGKTNLDQFATGLVGTRSPYGACSSVFDERYISGGSSAGSAVAVASGLVTFSLGTDTAGSGRIPAAFNGIVGLKPSCGLLSGSGVVPACRSLDCVSIFALSCRDAEVVFDVTRAMDSADPFSRSSAARVSSFPNRGLRFGVPQEDQLEFFGNESYRRLYFETLELLEQQGHRRVEIDFSPFRAAADLLYAGPYVAERFAAVGEFVAKNQDVVDPIVKSIVMGADRWSASDAYRALYHLKALEKQTGETWKQADVMVLPTAPTTYTIEQVLADPVKLNSNLGYYTNFVNLLDLCGVAVPAGFTEAGLPFGVTVISPAFSDSSLLAFAERIQPVKWILLGVAGAHLSGQPLNHQLTDRGAKLVRSCKTAASYRCFALQNTRPLKPGLVKVNGFKGPGIEIEVWSIPESQFGDFVAGVAAPLSIGTYELEDGSSVKGFLCESYATVDMPDITHLGGWRAFLKQTHP